MINKAQEYCQKIFYLDLRSLGLARIYIGLLLIFYTLWKYNSFATFYTDQGPITASQAQYESMAHKVFFLFFLSEKSTYIILTHLTLLVLAVFILLGWRARLASFIWWFAINCYVARNPYFLNGGDFLLSIVLLHFSFLPIEKRFSISTIKKNENEIVPTHLFSAVSFSLVTTMFLHYFMAGVWKFNPAWLNGNLLYYILSNDLWARPIANILSSKIDNTVLEVTNRFILCLELTLPLTLFLNIKQDWLRILFYIAFSVFHILILLLLNINFFPWISLGALLILFPSYFWKLILPGEQKAFFNKSKKNCGLQIQIVSVIFIVLTLFQVTTQILSYSFIKDAHLQSLIRKIKSLSGTTLVTQLFTRYTKYNFSFTFKAQMKTGELIDVFLDPNLYDKIQPHNIKAWIPNQQWLLLQQLISSRRKGDFLPKSFMGYLCKITKTNNPDSVVEKIVVTKINHPIPPPNEPLKQSRSFVFYRLEIDCESGVISKPQIKE